MTDINTLANTNVDAYIDYIIANNPPPKPKTYSLEELIKLLSEHKITIRRNPRNKQIKLTDKVSFSTFDKPNTVLRASINDILSNNTSEFVRDSHFRLSAEESSKASAKRLQVNEQHRLQSEEKLRQSMLNEQCILTSPYNTHNTLVHYTYNNKDYAVVPGRWNAGARPHLAKCVRYTNEHIRQLFADEDCELLTTYHHQKQPLQYRYKDKIYTICFNDWKHFNIRPHLNST